jgi:hypothetical protein
MYMNKYSVLTFAWEALLLESVGVGFLWALSN